MQRFPTCLNPPLNCKLFLKRSPLLQCRSAASTRHSSQPTGRSPRKVSKSNCSKNVSPAVQKAVTYESLNNRLAKRTSPTLLYQAASYKPYVLGCYSVGIALLSMAGFNYQSQFLFPSADLPLHVSYSTAVLSIMVACGGCYMIFKVNTPSHGLELWLSNVSDTKHCPNDILSAHLPSSWTTDIVTTNRAKFAHPFLTAKYCHCTSQRCDALFATL